MKQPTPAIVAQRAVKRLPRPALLLFCLAYVLPGFFGRGPWKRDDITSFGYMAELAQGQANWWHPTLVGLPPEVDGLLPYWLGAWMIQWCPSWLPPDLAARLPFIGLLVLTLIATWQGTYYLARSPAAQPLAFAFGGEARPNDYARALADGGLLAFIASLGLAQLAHETTPALTQLCFTALLFYASAALPYRPRIASLASGLALLGLALSGAPSMALALGLGCAVIHLLRPSEAATDSARQTRGATVLLVLSLTAAVVASALDLWRWRIDLPVDRTEWRSLGRLLLWFTWPTWPLALWTLWHWRRQLTVERFKSLHLWLPLWFVAVAIAATLATTAADRSLLLALPALAALAAFALPTFGRSMGALIDWFTLIFFTGCALIIWVVWISMQTGFPAQPAINVARLAPGFDHSFSWTPFLLALGASLCWAWLVTWRVGKHPAAIWKSVVLPAGGAALCWLLLMTLWLPLLDFARSYAPMVAQAVKVMGPQPGCVATLGLDRSQLAAFEFHARLELKTLTQGQACRWLIVDIQRVKQASTFTAQGSWERLRTVRHPAERKDALVLFKRRTEPAPAPAALEK